MALTLKPIRMKNSLYLLIPKGISELLSIREADECVLSTEMGENGVVLHYAFLRGGVRGESEPHRKKVSRERESPVRMG